MVCEEGVRAGDGGWGMFEVGWEMTVSDEEMGMRE